MDFDDSQAIDQIAWSFRYADFYRSQNRALINNLFNGVPPYSADEVETNNIAVNVNFLESTVKAHDARAQYYQAFLKPGNFFTLTTDYGVRHKRMAYGKTVTKEINRIMKRSLPYVEKHRSTFAQNVLHGIGPGGFRDSELWCPKPLGVEDVFVPASTLLTMDNLPFFAIHRNFTGPELIRLTRGPYVDEAWNMDMVKACLDWIDAESSMLMQTNWPQVWSPEKVAERFKADGGFYAYDNAPTVDAWDFYYWSDDGESSGWRRRMILDAWSNPNGIGPNLTRKTGVYDKNRDFLYNSKKRVFADQRESIINWQFADLSAVAPFRYHSIRSLGFLLYAVCNLQNRLRCKFAESVFEQMMVYFQINSTQDMQRALKVEMATRGFIDDNVKFIKAADRHQVNTPLVQLGLQENANIINQNANANTQNRTQGGRSSELPTATQWMGEESKITQMISAGLMQAYSYQVPEYREILRRFCIKNSKDPDVRRFQAACLRQGVPEKLLLPECWELEPERVMGAGNKTLEMAIAQQMLGVRNLLDPEPQRMVLHDYVLAITDDPARADAMVPDQPMKVSDSVHDAQIVAGTLMQGLPVGIKTGMNHIEYVETLMQSMATVVQRIQQTNGMGTMEEILGLQNMAQHIGQHIQIIAQDPNEKQRVKQYGDAMGKMMNMVKAFAQRLQEQQQQAQQNGQQQDPETMAKIQAMLITAKAKADNTRESHAQKTSQRQLQWEQEMVQKQKEAQLDEQQKQTDLQADFARTHMDLQADHTRAALDRQDQMHQSAQDRQDSMFQAKLDHHAELARTRLDLRAQAAKAAIDVRKEKEKAKAKPKTKSE